MEKLKNILILILIGVGIFLWVTRPQKVDLKEYIKIGGKKYELLSSKIDTVYKDTIIYKDNYIPSPPKIVKEVVEIPADVDTLAILTDYYQKYVYNDTITNIDGEGSMAFIKDTVTQNKIVSREAKFNIKNKTITETITVKEPERTKVFVGGGLEFGTNNFGLNGASAGFLVKPKNDKVFRLDLGAFNTPESEKITPYIGVGAYWKISFKKK